LCASIITKLGLQAKVLTISLSVLTAIFQVNLGKPVFIEAKDDGGGDDNYWSYKSCKAPVKSLKSSPPKNQHPDFLQAGCPSCRPTNSVKALKGKIWTCLPQAHLGSSNFVSDH